MTPVALWTGRLPGLRPLPRKRTLWVVGGIVLVGGLGAFGRLGENGPYAAALASLAIAWTVVRHRWPTELPTRLRPVEAPQGPDERAVMVEFRHDGALLGWDVGILWFERGGVGFLGRTVSFVIPRSILGAVPDAHPFQSIFRAPQLTAKVFETTVGIVPLAPELRAQMTLARIDALPDAVTSETILPPGSMHPDLLQRGLAVRRRRPCLTGLCLANVVLVWGPISLHDLGADVPRGLPHIVATLTGFVVWLYTMAYGSCLPRSVRERLPK